MTRAWTDDALIDADAGASDPDQPPDRRHAARREAVQAIRDRSDILPNPQRGAFAKEDGEKVVDARGTRILKCAP